MVGEGVSEPAGGPHAEAIALEAAGEAARSGTIFVTMEPCAHHGRTPPCVDRILEAGVAHVIAGCADPNPEAGGGAERLGAAGVAVELLDLPEARRQNEAWRTWVTERRPYVILKLAVSLDGRVTVPGRRWVTGEESRRRVHELRAAVDAVAVGMGTVRADAPRLDVRDASVARQPRRLAFGRGPLPEARSSSCATARSPTNSGRSPPKASSRFSSRAAPGSRRRFSRLGWSTACSCSSRRSSRERDRR